MKGCFFFDALVNANLRKEPAFCSKKEEGIVSLMIRLYCRSVHQQKKTILPVSHRESTMAIADRICRMENGVLSDD